WLVVSATPVPGRLRWLTGPNAGSRLYQVEAYSAASGTIALLESVAYAIAIGHTYEIRRDCNKSPSHCIGYGNLINYKGEPFIPTGDGLETMTPSAQVFGGLSGSAIAD
ncbi:MAG: phage BR0599 family protein, partial [Pseudomonadaceae bacterium]|nr:phage BR0599 family protein [Pseudomonadaceae bacterium]